MRKIAAEAQREKSICVKDFGKIKLTHSCLQISQDLVRYQCAVQLKVLQRDIDRDVY